MLPPRPAMPSAEDETRSRHQSMRWRLLVDRWDEDLYEYLQEQVDADVLRTWGSVDTSANPLADLCSQLSTPGLYGRRPKVRGPEGSEGLIGEHGALAKAGWYTRGQHLQYLTVGLGDLFARFGVSASGRLTYRFALPQDVWLRQSATEPGRVAELRELRLYEVEGQQTYTWDVYDLEAEVYQVHAATGTFAGQDITELVLGRRYEGADYPWRDGEEAVLPFVHYQDRDTGSPWNHWLLHGLHRGTLNVATAWSYAAQCARHATSSVVLAWGLEAPVQTTRAGGGDRVHTSDVLQASPGAIIYHRAAPDSGSQGVVEVGPGANLAEVRAFAEAQEMRVAVRLGLNPSDLSRTAANPSSAAALMVSNEGKREVSARVEPVFRARDLEAIGCAAMVLRSAGVADYPGEGYAIEYHQIPRTSTEQRERRDEQTWELEQGLTSLVDVYLDRHPGATREDAIAHLRRVREDQAALHVAAPATTQPPES